MTAVWIALAAVLLVALAIELLAWRAVRLGRREAPACFAAPPRRGGEAPTASLAFLGDVQRGVRDVARPLARALGERPTDLLVSSGDLVAHGEAPYYGVLLEALARAGLETPIRVVPGNHDLCPRGVADPTGGYALFEARIGTPAWTVRVGPVLVAGLDVAVRGFDADLRAALEGALDEHDGPWIAVCHRPPRALDRTEAPVEPDVAELVALLEARPPALVVCGHLHDYVEREVNGVTYVVNAHGGDVHGLHLGRGSWELLRVEVDEEGRVTHERTHHPRGPSLRVYLDQLAVRCWWSRRSGGGRLLSAPVGLPLALVGWRAPLH